MDAKLTRLRIRGLRTIRDSGDISPGPITVLIGPNGAGKSNFVSFFRLMAYMLTPPGKLNEYVQFHGPPSKILFDGPDVTQDLSSEIEISTELGKNGYRFRLSFASGDRFVFTQENWRFSRHDLPTPAPWSGERVGHQESVLLEEAERGDKTARVIRDLLRRVVVYQFHNTSQTARIRGKWDTADNRYLKEDGANLASVLLRLNEHKPDYYHRIVVTIRRVLPFFSDFEFDPKANHQILSWHERYTDRVFDASQAADGMLRVMALCTLLLLPEDNLPNAIVLDEPELGLHPSAINLLGALIRSVSSRAQVILATQSPPLVDCFEPDEIIVVERMAANSTDKRAERTTTFKNLDSEKLREWLESYSLSELWDKNVIGGRP